MIKETIERLKKPTPKFFRKLRNVALLVGAVASGLATGGIAPAIMGTIIAVSGTVASVSQLVTKEEQTD